LHGYRFQGHPFFWRWIRLKNFNVLFKLPLTSPFPSGVPGVTLHAPEACRWVLSLYSGAIPCNPASLREASPKSSSVYPRVKMDFMSHEKTNKLVIMLVVAAAPHIYISVVVYQVKTDTHLRSVYGRLPRIQKRNESFQINSVIKQHSHQISACRSYVGEP